jgi:hypothetical protein
MNLQRRAVRVITCTVNALNHWSGRHRMSTREIGQALQLLTALADAERLLTENIDVQFHRLADQAGATGRLTAWQRELLTDTAKQLGQLGVAISEYDTRLRAAVDAVHEAGFHL